MKRKVINRRETMFVLVKKPTKEGVFAKEWQNLWDVKIQWHIEEIEKCYKKDNNVPEDATLTKEQERDMWYQWCYGVVI